MKRTALITGASSGIGEALADVFPPRASTSSSPRGARIGFTPSPNASSGDTPGASTSSSATSRRRDAVERLCAEIDARGLQIDALVNNAGYGVPGRTRRRWKPHADFLQVLVTAVADLTHLFLPGMLQRDHGRIVNVASLAGLCRRRPATRCTARPRRSSSSSPSRSLRVRAPACCHRGLPGVHAQRVPRRDRDARPMKDAARDVDGRADGGARGLRRRDGGRSIYVNGSVNRAIATLVRLFATALSARWTQVRPNTESCDETAVLDGTWIAQVAGCWGSAPRRIQWFGRSVRAGTTKA